MLEKIIASDKELFLYLNDKHHHVIDPLMVILSSYALWGIVFVLCGILIYIYAEKKYKMVSAVFYGVSVCFCTLFTNGLKLIIQRPRPIHEVDWIGKIHNLESYSNSTSFFSSHAATTFCIAIFTLCNIKQRKLVGVIAVLWAFGVSYSRIYVGKHYPLDVTVGILFGSFIGILVAKLLQQYRDRNESKIL